MKKEHPNMRRVIRAFAVTWVLGLSAGTWAPAVVAQTPAAPVEVSAGDAESLRVRAAAFWAARVAGDYKTQWELLEPRGRGRITASEYASQRGRLKYLAYQVEDASVAGYFGVVKVRVLVQPILMPGRQTIGPQAVIVPDEWILIGGTWYHALEQQGARGAQVDQR
jgi:hypothetical protein